MTQAEKAFVNSFWGKGDHGYFAIQLRIKNSLQTLEEIMGFLREKAHLEAEFTKRMDKFYAHQQLGLAENGTLKVALDTLLVEGRHMVGHQEKLVAQTTQQNYEKLRNFHLMYSKNVAKIESHMLKLNSRRKDHERRFALCKEKYRLNCSLIKTLTLVCQTTCGKEMEKSSAKLSKLRSEHEALRSAYYTAVKTYGEICDIWITDWSIALLNIYQLEIERIQICKLNMFSYCNHVATLCVDWDLAIDNARSCFARVAAPVDAYDFADSYGTGDQIYEPPVFVEFMDGVDDDEESTTNSHPAQFKDPDYSTILSRTFSTPSGLKTRPFDGATPTNVSPVSPPKPNQLTRQSPPKPTLVPHQSPQKLPQHPMPTARHNGDVLSANTNKQLPPITTHKLETNFLLPKDDGRMHPESSPKGKYASPTNENIGQGAKQLHKMPSHISNYTSGTDNDVFDPQHMKNSNGLSEYSNATNYTNPNSRPNNDTATNQYSQKTVPNYGNFPNYGSKANAPSGRSWATPRANVPTDVQKEINRRLKEMLEMYMSQMPKESLGRPSVPITKDFSIDFIAQALQDLNAGGDGDIDRFRRSVRGSQAAETPEDRPFQVPASDYVDDMHETATRYDSINFETRARRRHTMEVPRPQVQTMDATEAMDMNDGNDMRQARGGEDPAGHHMRVKNVDRRHGVRMSFPSGNTKAERLGIESGRTMELLAAGLMETVVRKHTDDHNGRPRALLQSPTKSYLNLQAIVDRVTPVTRRKYVSKAVAKHSYRCREAGELTFLKGWHMYIIHKQEDNWYVCELGENCGTSRGSVGLVPYNYIVEGDAVF